MTDRQITRKSDCADRKKEPRSFRSAAPFGEIGQHVFVKRRRLLKKSQRNGGGAGLRVFMREAVLP